MVNDVRPKQKTRARRLLTAALFSTALVGLAASGGWEAALAQNPPPANAAVANLHHEDTGYADLVAAVKPAVVNVRVEKSENAEEAQAQSPFNDPEMRKFFERFFGQVPPGHPQAPQPEKVVGEGSGFFINPDGTLVTNAHVAGGATKIEVTTVDGTKYPAKLVGIDEKTDLAVLRVQSKKAMPYVTFGDSSKARVGDRVVAVGNPFGLGGTVTSGIISASNREIGAGPYDDFLQTDAAINRGNSGGPLFNVEGQVIGVNSAIFSPNGGSVGIGFAIASNLVKDVTQQLIQTGKVERGWLGVAIQPVDQDIASSLGLKSTDGALVSQVEPNSPAAKAGIQRGDVVTSINGQKVNEPRALSRDVADVAPNKTAKLEVVRNGKQETIDVTVGSQPKQQDVASNQQAPQKEHQARLGLSLAPLDQDARSQLGLPDDVRGVVVADVTAGSPAETKGIQSGDVILSIDRKNVREPRQVAEAVKQAAQHGQKAVLMLIMRDGHQIFEAVPLAVS